MNDKFGIILRQLRRSRNLSQIEFAQMLNVAQQTITKWENGYREPPFDTLCIIADLFHVSTDLLLGRSEASDDIQALSPKEQQLVDLYKSLNTQGQHALITTATIIAGNPSMIRNSTKIEEIS